MEQIKTKEGIPINAQDLAAQLLLLIFPNQINFSTLLYFSDAAFLKVTYIFTLGTLRYEEEVTDKKKIKYL